MAETIFYPARNFVIAAIQTPLREEHRCSAAPSVQGIDHMLSVVLQLHLAAKLSLILVSPRPLLQAEVPSEILKFS